MSFAPVVTSDIDAATNRFISTGSTPVSYDGGTATAGNITNDGKFRFLSYTYDANNRQITASNGTWTETQVYDGAGQRVQTSTSSGARTMVYDIFGQDVADYAGSSGTTLARENVYRGGQLLATQDYPLATTTQNVSWTNAVGVSVSGNSLTQTASSGWGNAGAASIQGLASGDGYVEFTVGSSADDLLCGLSHGDTDQAYQDIDFALYVSHYNGNVVYVFEGGTNTGQVSTVTTGDRFRISVVSGVVKYYKIVSGTPTLLYTSSTTPTYPLVADTAPYNSGCQINSVVISGNLSSGLTYVLQDAQGSTRAAINNNSTSSTVIARHDHLPFGEEIASGVGQRTVLQGYGAAAAIDSNRQKYGLTERDDTSGLDHTWFKKYESFSGRWTSADPYGGSAKITVPQSLNRYAYVQNDPINLVDPSGLFDIQCYDRYTVTSHISVATGEKVGPDTWVYQ